MSIIKRLKVEVLGLQRLLLGETLDPEEWQSLNAEDRASKRALVEEDCLVEAIRQLGSRGQDGDPYEDFEYDPSNLEEMRRFELQREQEVHRYSALMEFNDEDFPTLAREYDPYLETPFGEDGSLYDSDEYRALEGWISSLTSEEYERLYG